MKKTMLMLLVMAIFACSFTAKAGTTTSTVAFTSFIVQVMSNMTDKLLLTYRQSSTPTAMYLSITNATVQGVDLRVNVKSLDNYVQVGSTKKYVESDYCITNGQIVVVADSARAETRVWNTNKVGIVGLQIIFN